MSGKGKKSNPVDDIKSLKGTVENMLVQVDKTIETYDKVRGSLDEETTSKIDPMVDTLKRDRKAHSRDVERISKKIEGIRSRPKRVEQYMKVHNAGTEMFETIGKIESATLPLVADVMTNIDEGINKCKTK